MDEATSSLDSKTEEKIQKALGQLTQNKTTIVIAHRLSTILNSDNIYVVDSGKIIDSGKHEELLLQSKVYIYPPGLLYCISAYLLPFQLQINNTHTQT